jgi:hypothetical protein
MATSRRPGVRARVAVLRETDRHLVLKTYAGRQARPGRLWVEFLGKNTVRATYLAGGRTVFKDLTFHRYKPGKKTKPKPGQKKPTKTPVRATAKDKSPPPAAQPPAKPAEALSGPGSAAASTAGTRAPAPAASTPTAPPGALPPSRTPAGSSSGWTTPGRVPPPPPGSIPPLYN